MSFIERWDLEESSRPTSDVWFSLDDRSGWAEAFAPQTDVVWSYDIAHEAVRKICHIYIEHVLSGCLLYTPAQAPATVRSDEAVAAVSRAVTVLLRSWQPVPGFRAHVLSELARLRQLPAGWDGYRAPAINPQIIDAATTLANRLPDDIAPAPRVVPLASGGLQLEWGSGQVALELEFESPTTIRYLKWNPLEGEPEEDTLDIANNEQIQALIRWYARRHV